jgi:hypothetical protein
MDVLPKNQRHQSEDREQNNARYSANPQHGRSFHGLVGDASFPGDFVFIVGLVLARKVKSVGRDDLAE